MFGTPKVTKVKKSNNKSKAGEYVLKIQSLGAGLQSSCITEMIVEGELPKVDVVIFADTGDEPDYVYKQIEYLKGRLEKVSIPLIVVTAGNLVEDIYQDRRKASIPVFTKNTSQIGRVNDLEVYTESVGRLKRQCTNEYKIVPIYKWIKNYLFELGLAKKNKKGAISVLGNVQCQLGISFDEIQRMKPSREKWIDNTWPLIDRKMKRKDCENWLIAHNLPVPKKSSCRICPYHTLPYFRNMRDNSPSDWKHVVKFDNDLRNGNVQVPAVLNGELYLLQDCIPLEQVNLDTPQEKGQLDMCDEGYCFI